MRVAHEGEGDRVASLYVLRCLPITLTLGASHLDLSRSRGRGYRTRERLNHLTITFLNCHGSLVSISSGNNPPRPSSGVQSV